MPDYFPNLCEVEGSGRQVRSGNMVRIASNGKPRNRSLQSETFEDPSMMYTNLTKAQIDEIRTFFDEHRDVEFYLRDHMEDEILNVVFAEPPFIITPYPDGAGVRFRAQVNFVHTGAA